MTRCGTWVPPGPSRNAAGCPFTWREKDGNCERTQARSSALMFEVNRDDSSIEEAISLPIRQNAEEELQSRVPAKEILVLGLKAQKLRAKSCVQLPHRIHALGLDLEYDPGFAWLA